MSNLDNLLEIIHPYYCNNKIRVGSKYDGGYVLPKQAVDDADLLLSFGIATNIDFEKHINRLNKDIEIRMFDPFTGPTEDFGRLIKKPSDQTKVAERKPKPQSNPEYTEKIIPLPIRILHRLYFWMMFYTMPLYKPVTFKKLGLRDYCDKMFINFEALFNQATINKKQNIIIKIDIECDEYRVWRQLLPYLSKVSAIVIEVHQVGKYYPELIELINTFKINGLYPIHLHGNNVDHLIEDTVIPNCLEITFCKQTYCEPLVPDKNSYPIKGLDAPCNPSWLDYELPFNRKIESVFHSNTLT